MAVLEGTPEKPDRPEKPQPAPARYGAHGPLVAIVIPARLESERLPGKLLKDATGQPLLTYALDAAMQATKAADVGFITDSVKLYEVAARRYKGRALPLCLKRQAVNGSHRVGHWVDHFDAWDTYDVVVNMQADEPCIDPRDLDNLIAACSVTERICTLVTKLQPDDQQDANVVKAWVRGDNIVDFSRALRAEHPVSSAREHVGVYAFPRAVIEVCLSNKQGKRAKESRLEQLTWLDAGLKMRAVELKYTDQPISINTPRDYAKFIQWCKRQ